MFVFDDQKRVFRAFLALGIFIAVVFVGIAKWRALSSSENEELRDNVASQADVMLRMMRVILEPPGWTYTRLASRMSTSTSYSEGQWGADVDNLMHDYPYVGYVEWLESDLGVRTFRSRDGFLTNKGAHDADRPLPDGYTSLPDGQSMLIIPLIRNGMRTGSLVVRGDLFFPIKAVLQPYVESGYGVSVTTNGKLVCCNNYTATPEFLVQRVMEIEGLTLKIEVWPTDRLSASTNSPLAKMPLVMSPIVGALLAMVIYLLLGSRAKSRLIAAAHDDLKNLLLAIEQCNASVVVTDQNGLITYANNHYRDKCRSDCVNTNAKDVQCELGGDRSCAFYGRMYEVAKNHKAWEGEVHSKDGDRWEYLHVTPVVGSEGGITHFIGVGYDITDRKYVENRLKNMAYFDALTGLYNRSYLEENSELFLIRADRTERSLAVMFVDLDRFKEANDTYGHEVGDTLLKGVASRLRECLRDGDIVVRLGGDEFVIVLTDVRDRNDVMPVVDIVANCISKPFKIQGHEIVVEASIGISIYPGDGTSMDELINKADGVMYRVKKTRSGQTNFSKQEN